MAITTGLTVHVPLVVRILITIVAVNHLPVGVYIVTYVQYYETNLAGKLDWVLGDRGVVVLDGRNSLSTQKLDAVRLNGYRRPKYEAYSIHKGRGFNDSVAITPIIEL